MAEVCVITVSKTCPSPREAFAPLTKYHTPQKRFYIYHAL